jgi:hypothetical protein
MPNNRSDANLPQLLFRLLKLPQLIDDKPKIFFAGG